MMKGIIAQQNSYLIVNWGAFDDASHSPQLRQITPLPVAIVSMNPQTVVLQPGFGDIKNVERCHRSLVQNLRRLYINPDQR